VLRERDTEGEHERNVDPIGPIGTSSTSESHDNAINPINRMAPSDAEVVSTSSTSESDDDRTIRREPVLRERGTPAACRDADPIGLIGSGSIGRSSESSGDDDNRNRRGILGDLERVRDRPRSAVVVEGSIGGGRDCFVDDGGSS
jgi:hypothetical protein